MNKKDNMDKIVKETREKRMTAIFVDDRNCESLPDTGISTSVKILRFFSISSNENIATR